MNNVLGMPDFVTVFTSGKKQEFRADEMLSLDDISVKLLPDETGFVFEIAVIVL